MKASIDKTKEAFDQRRAKHIKETVEKLIQTCHLAMEKAASAGEFYCEVTVPNDEDVQHLIMTAMAEFSPSWNGDGYTHKVICLRWD